MSARIGAGSGVVCAEYRLDNGSWTRGTSRAAPAPADALHGCTVGYRSAGNAGKVARKGRPVRLRYLFSDNLSDCVWNVKVTVKSARGRTVKRYALGFYDLEWVDTTYSVKWRRRARGRYRYFVTCEDDAGNRQSVRAKGRVIVR